MTELMHRVRAAVEVLAGDVLDRLPVRQRIDAVADLHVAGDRADERIGEAADELADRVAREDRVGVERDDDLAARVRDAAIQRRRLAGVLLPQQPHADRRRTRRITSPEVSSFEPSSTTMISRSA